MPKGPDSGELRSWIEGQATADAFRREELAAMSAEDKLRQIGRLMASAPLFDMSRRDAGDDAVRELWCELRARYQEADERADRSSP